MTDGDTAHEPGGRTGPDRSTLMVGGGLAVVLLAAIGATGGWLLAGGDEEDRTSVAAPTPSISRTAAPPAARPTVTRPQPSAPRTTAAASSPGLTVPQVVGMDFEDAREELRERRLGWRLVFGAGVGDEVDRASPGVGEPVTPGRTVTLYVRGPAPAQEVPDVVGENCAEAADELVDDGFYPDYPQGRTGVVGRQEPVADSAARWNDKVVIWCGPTVTVSPVPTP